MESDICNCNVLCFLKGKSRKLAHFVVNPPDVGQYYLKVYAKPEGEIVNDNDTLDHVATFLIHVQQVIIDLLVVTIPTSVYIFLLI